MSSDNWPAGFTDTRLDTWKSIAQYLSRSSRTVQRWHSEYGLPVHHLGGDASSVFAYRDELDSWLRKRDNATGEDHTAGEPRQKPVAMRGPSIRIQPVDDGALKDISSKDDEAAALIDRAQKLWESLSRSNISTITQLFRRASDLDPANSAAFSGLAHASMAQAVLGNLHPEAAFHSAQAAFNRAWEIDPTAFGTLCASAMLSVFRHRDWDGAQRSLAKAMLLNPLATQVLVVRAFLAVAQGSLEEASECLRRASSERPLNSSVVELLCWVEYLSGRFESTLELICDARDLGHSGALLETVEALCGVLLTGPKSQIQHLESLTSSAPRNYSLLGVLGYAYGKTGQFEAARDVIELMAHPGLAGTYQFAYAIALTHLGLGEREQAAKWLERSYREGSIWGLGFRSDPILAGFRGEAARGGLFAEWLEPSIKLQNEIKQVVKPILSFSA